MNTSRPINLRFTLAAIFCALFLLATDARSQSGPPLPPPVPVAALSFWPLEAPSWENLRGEPARAWTNLAEAPSWDYEGTDLSVGTNVPAFLQLDVFEEGKPTLNLTNGSLEIWCAPYWSSMADSGTGPMAWASIWDIGCYTTDASIGAWLLAVDPSGSNLVWLAQSGGSNQTLWTGIDFDAGDFHQVIATWSASNSCLYVDGELATNAGPILYRPSSLECSNDGFCVGSLSATSGTNQFQGQLQWLVSYAYPLSAEEVAANFSDVSAYISYFGYSVPGSGGFHSDTIPALPGTNWGTNSGWTNSSGGGNPFYGFSTNGLWMQITGITNGIVSINLNNATNYVYEIYSTEALSSDLANWNIETNVFPTNASVMPFTVPVLDRTNSLYFYARDWTGITSNGNTVPEWWLYFWYGGAGLSLSDNTLDASGQQTLLYDYTRGINPLDPYDTPPLYIMPPYALWNVTDISDPGQPVAIGELREPFSEPGYPLSGGPPLNTLWHTNRGMTFTEAYGTTVAGGAGKGTVYKLDPAGPLQGCQPDELIVSGNLLFGTTAGFGGNAFEGNGTIFNIGTNGQGFTNAYDFIPLSGEEPEAGLLLSGNTLYGTTLSGGSGYGTVFSFDTNNGYTELYAFKGYGEGDGQNPQAKLILSGSTLYGTTSGGGANNKGTVFEVNTNGSGYSVLQNFDGSDGETPDAALLLSGGILYGTTSGGGAHGHGTVFSFNLGDVTYVILHAFGGSGDDGLDPEAGLVISGSTLYGTTAYGGTSGDGTVFSIDTGGTNYIILHSFDESSTNGAAPGAGLVLSGSSLYGTTELGGANDYGVVFCINTSGSGYTNLYSFQDGADGQLPNTTLTLAGNTLYGTTPGDLSLVGDPNCGTIFSINTNGSDFTVLSTFSTFFVLHTFAGTNDGAYPSSQLALSGSASWGIPTTLYGTTYGGGSSNYGTVFKVNTDGTGFADLYDFTGGSDGRYPSTGLLIYGNTLYGTTTNSLFKINTDGSDFTCLTNIDGASQLILSMSGSILYGTTKNGGVAGYGTVFGIGTNGGGFTNLYTFAGGTNGACPSSGLALYGIGSFLYSGPTTCTLYGTTESNGANNCGLVFSINTDGSGFADLHDFDGTNDGAYPIGGLLVTNNNVDGNSDSFSDSFLFGTTSSGGTNGGGTLWGINLAEPATSFQTLHGFGGILAGTQPAGRLAFLGSLLIGTTSEGGAYTNGTVFGVNSDGTGFAPLYDFGGGDDGGTPLSGLTLSVADNLVSLWSLDTTINVSSANVSNLYYSIAIDNLDALYVNGNFVSLTSGDSAQRSPFAFLPYLHEGTNDVRTVIGGDGDHADYFAMVIKSAAPGAVFTNAVFGTTEVGGNGYGTAFEITPEGDEVVLYSFSGSTNGANPVGDLVFSGGTLYGVTENGGMSEGTGFGTIFSLATNGVFQTLYTFTNSSDGANPLAGLILSGNALYGTTSAGGTNGFGTVFGINTNGSNFATLYSFAGGSDGEFPEAPLLLASNTLYGTTYEGGIDLHGTVFSIGTNGSDYTSIYKFGTNSDSDDGINPQAGLTFSSNALYGVTEQGGTNTHGEIFRINVNGSQYTNLYDFGGEPDGANPVAALILSGNTLYGTTENGGAYGDGTIFSIGIGGAGYTILQSLGSPDTDYAKNPVADLIMLGDSLYGTTSQGGASTDGMVFGIGTNGSGFNDIYDFSGPDGKNPSGGLCAP